MKLQFILLFLGSWTILQAQTIENEASLKSRKNQLGIHLCPLLDADNMYMAKSYSFMYGRKVCRSITFGAEISALFYKQDIEYTKNFNDHHTISVGLLGRYSFLADRRLQPYLEAEPIYNFYYPRYYDRSPYSEPGLNAASGISLFSKRARFSIDLYYRLSTITNINGRNGAFLYRLNFHF
jgi:hypothetical protein